MPTESIPTQAPSSRTVWIRRWPWLAGAVLLLALYAAVGFFYLPRFARDSAIDYVDKALRHRLSIGELRFNPFTLTADIKNLALSEADGMPIASLAELRVNFELSSLWHRAYTFKQVRLTAPDLNVVVNADGSLNLAALQAPADPGAAEQGLPAVRIEHFELTQGQLHLEDRSRPQTFAATLRPIEFTLQNFRTQPNYGNVYHFAAVSTANERLDWSGEFTVQPLGSKGQFTVAGLQAGTLASYLQDALPFQLQSGALDFQGGYQFALGDQLTDQLELALQLPAIKAHNLRIAPKQATAATPWITVPELELDASASLAKRSLAIQKLALRGMQIELQREADGGINLLKLLGSDEHPDESAGETNWNIDVKAVEVQNAAVHAEDRSTKTAAKFTLEPVNLQVHNYSTAPGAIVELNAELGINQTGRLNVQGTLQPDTLNTQAKLTLRGLELGAFQPYVSEYTDMVVQSGSLSAQGELQYDSKPVEKAKLQFAGDVEVSNLATQDKAQAQDFVKWRLLQAKGVDYRQSPDQLTIQQIYARQPYGRVMIAADRSTNVQRILRLSTADSGAQDNRTGQDAQAKPSNSSLRTRIGKVVIENGSANFADYSVEPSFATGILKLNGTVTGLSSANGSRAEVKLNGSVDNYAPVSITGDVNFLAADVYSDLALNFRNMELTTFNPYSGKFAGYSIAKGKLSTELRYQIRDRKLDAQHHIVIDQLEFGAATDSKDAVPLPIKLAVSLLKDREGVIDLNLPVGGSLDDPSFRVGPIVWKAFVNLLSKIVTAPFSALGALFGSGEELAYIDFSPGSSTLNPEQINKLATLSKALLERPQLKLDIPLTVVTEADAMALARAAYEQALAPLLPKNAVATPPQRLAALSTLYMRKFQAAPRYQDSEQAGDVTAAHIDYLERELLAGFGADVNQREALARARADAVQAALLGNSQLSAERIFLTARAAQANAPEGAVRMELKLE